MLRSDLNSICIVLIIWFIFLVDMPFTGCKGVLMVQIGKYFGWSKNMPPSKLYLVLAKVCNTLAHLLCKYPLTLSSPSFLLIIIQVVSFFSSNFIGYLRQRKYLEEGNIYMNGSQRRCYTRPLLTDYVFLRSGVTRRSRNSGIAKRGGGLVSCPSR